MIKFFSFLLAILVISENGYSTDQRSFQEINDDLDREARNKLIYRMADRIYTSRDYQPEILKTSLSYYEQLALKRENESLRKENKYFLHNQDLLFKEVELRDNHILKLHSEIKKCFLTEKEDKDTQTDPFLIHEIDEKISQNKHLLEEDSDKSIEAPSINESSFIFPASAPAMSKDVSIIEDDKLEDDRIHFSHFNSIPKDSVGEYKTCKKIFPLFDLLERDQRDQLLSLVRKKEKIETLNGLYQKYSSQCKKEYGEGSLTFHPAIQKKYDMLEMTNGAPFVPPKGEMFFFKRH